MQINVPSERTTKQFDTRLLAVLFLGKPEYLQRQDTNFVTRNLFTDDKIVIISKKDYGCGVVKVAVIL
jgi:hypothetical protein